MTPCRDAPITAPLEPGADLPVPTRPAREPLSLLLARSGFPEPLLSGTDRSLPFFRERLGLRHCYQVVLEGSRDFLTEGVRCLPASRFLAGLP